MATSPLASLRGAARPRIRLAPDSVYSFGPEATELSRRAGLVLDEWQADGVDIILSVRADGKWACFEYCEWCSRQNGKTVGIFTPRALAGMFLTGEPLVTWSAHEYKTAMEGFRTYKGCLLTLGVEIRLNVIQIENDPDPILVKISNTNGDESFERLDTGQRVKFIARSKGSGRGFGASSLIDETFAYTREHQDAIMPTILAQDNPQIGYASSPPLTGDTGEVMYSLRSRAENGEIGALGYRDWGIGGDLDHLSDVDLDDWPLQQSANPATVVGRLTREKIQHLRNSMSGVGFAREVLGVWPVELGTGSAIEPARWAAMADPLSRREGDLGLGVDITPARDFASIALYGNRLDGLGHAQLIDYRAGTEWIVPRLVELRELKPVAVGMGAAAYRSLAPDLAKAGFTEPEKPDAPARGDLAVAGGADMAAACGQMIDASKQASFRHVGQPQLDAAVAGAQTRLSGDSIVWSRKDASTDICPLVGLTVARWAFLTRIDALAAAPATARVPVDAPDPSELWRPTQRLEI